MRIGRPTRLNVTLIENIAKALEGGVTRRGAARANGISPRSLFHWLAMGKKVDEQGNHLGDPLHVQLVEAVEAAEGRGEKLLVDVVREAATKHLDWHAASWLLCRRYPEWSITKAEYERRGQLRAEKKHAQAMAQGDGVDVFALIQMLVRAHPEKVKAALESMPAPTEHVQ